MDLVSFELQYMLDSDNIHGNYIKFLYCSK